MKKAIDTLNRLAENASDPLAVPVAGVAGNILAAFGDFFADVKRIADNSERIASAVESMARSEEVIAHTYRSVS